MREDRRLKIHCFLSLFDCQRRVLLNSEVQPNTLTETSHSLHETSVSDLFVRLFFFILFSKNFVIGHVFYMVPSCDKESCSRVSVIGMMS